MRSWSSKYLFTTSTSMYNIKGDDGSDILHSGGSDFYHLDEPNCWGSLVR